MSGFTRKVVKKPKVVEIDGELYCVQCRAMTKHLSNYRNTKHWCKVCGRIWESKAG